VCLSVSRSSIEGGEDKIIFFFFFIFFSLVENREKFFVFIINCTKELLVLGLILGLLPLWVLLGFDKGLSSCYQVYQFCVVKHIKIEVEQCM